MKKRIINTLVTCSVFLALLSFSSGSVFAKKVLLKVPVWFPTALPALGTSPAWIEKQINAIGGDVKIKVYEPGKLVPPKEMLESVSKGQVNAGYTTPGYNTGKLGDKGAIFSAVPFGPDAQRTAATTDPTARLRGCLGDAFTRRLHTHRAGVGMLTVLY